MGLPMVVGLAVVEAALSTIFWLAVCLMVGVVVPLVPDNGRPAMTDYASYEGSSGSVKEATETNSGQTAWTRYCRVFIIVYGFTAKVATGATCMDL